MSDQSTRMMPAPSDAHSREAAPRFDQGIFLTHLNRGRDLLHLGKLDQARAELERALALRPRDEATLDLLGMIYFKLDMRTEAASVYRLLLELHPEADVLHANLGILDFKNGRYEDARRRLETALLLNPRNLRPHLHLGLIQRFQGNLDASLRHLAAAGAATLIARLTASDGPQRPAAAQDDADTGPMLAIQAGATMPARPLDLRSLVEQDAGRAATAREGRTALFRVRRSTGPVPADVLELIFRSEVRVQAGSVLHLQGTAGSLGAAPADPAGMVSLRGTGRLELVPTNGRAGRIALMELSPGQHLHVAAGRLLAHEASVGRSGARASVGLSEIILTGSHHLSGAGIAALSIGGCSRAVALTETDLLLVNPRDLVCWTGSLRARLASTSRLEAILASGEGASPAAAITLEGTGEIVIDTPA